MHRSAKGRLGREDTAWTPTTPEEIQQFIGMKVAMSILELPQTKGPGTAQDTCLPAITGGLV